MSPSASRSKADFGVESIAPPAPFLGSPDAHPARPARKVAQEATDESQHLCPQGHQPRLRGDRERMGATSRGICTPGSPEFLEH